MVGSAEGSVAPG